MDTKAKDLNEEMALYPNQIIIRYGNIDYVFSGIGTNASVSLCCDENSVVDQSDNTIRRVTVAKRANIDFSYKKADVIINDGVFEYPEKIIKNPDKNATTVKWKDGTYTTVKQSPDDPDDDYMAFCAALAIKTYGSNSAVKRLIRKNIEVLKKKNKGGGDTDEKSRQDR